MPIKYEDLPILTTNMFGETCQQVEHYCTFCSHVKGGYCKNCKIDPTDLNAKPSKFLLAVNH